ncbi:MAG: glycoside hydrolase, partial [Anaerolineae bacterium]|nr:glycoside hydrolase [Anaerolineae bacterium]
MIKKQYLKSRPACKVTFQVPASVAAENVKLVGDFNDWSAVPMEQLKDGRFKAVVELEQGRE